MGHDREGLKPLLIAAREGEFTLRHVAEQVGVEVATVYRWQAADRAFRDTMREAKRL